MELNRCINQSLQGKNIYTHTHYYSQLLIVAQSGMAMDCYICILFYFFCSLYLNVLTLKKCVINYRYVSAKRYCDALDILHAGACIQFEHQQVMLLLLMCILRFTRYYITENLYYEGLSLISFDLFIFFETKCLKQVIPNLLVNRLILETSILALKLASLLGMQSHGILCYIYAHPHLDSQVWTMICMCARTVHMLSLCLCLCCVRKRMI